MKVVKIQNPFFKGLPSLERGKKEERIQKEKYKGRLHKIQNQSTERKKKIGEYRIQNEEITYGIHKIIYSITPKVQSAESSVSVQRTGPFGWFAARGPRSAPLREVRRVGV